MYKSKSGGKRRLERLGPRILHLAETVLGLENIRASTPESERQICGGPIYKSEVVYGLDLTGGNLPDRVELLYRRSDDVPFLARLFLGRGEAVLVAPDRVILGVEDSLSAEKITGLLHERGEGLLPQPMNGVDYNELGGGAWLITVSPSSSLFSSPLYAKKELIAKAPGLAVLEILSKRHREDGAWSSGGRLRLRSLSFDRMITLERLPAVSRLYSFLATILGKPPQCLASMGVIGLEKYAHEIWWQQPEKVAIVDSGLSINQRLQHIRWAEAVDASRRGDPVFATMASRPCEVACEQYPHGTQVAGAVAAFPYGIARHAPLVPIKVFDEFGCGWSSSITKGLHQAAQRARIVVLAWTFSAPDSPQCPREGTIVGDEICHAISSAQDVLFVASAGNQGNDLVSDPVYPPAWERNLENLLVVGGVSLEDKWIGNKGREIVHLAAIAARCKTTLGNNSAYVEGGTSLAAGYVAGAASLYWAKHSGATVAEVKSALIQGARLYGTSTFKNFCEDCGILDVSNILDHGPEEVR